MAGLRFRTARGPSDLEHLVAVFEACRAVDRLATVRSAEHYAALFRAVNLDPARDLLFADVDGLVVGYAGGAEDGETEGLGRRLHHIGQVRPEWRRRGIGSALLGRTQDRLRRRFGAPPDTPASFLAEVEDTELDARRLLERDGYRPIRHHVHMVRPSLDDIPEPALPDGLEVRPVVPTERRRVDRAFDEAMADHWGWVAAVDDAQYDALAEHPLYGQSDAWQVAWDGDEVVGGVLGWIDDAENAALGRRRGYTERIFVRRPWRRRGIATALIARHLSLLRQRGMTESALSVDTENPSGALGLYERLGFRPTTSRIFLARPVEAR